MSNLLLLKLIVISIVLFKNKDGSVILVLQNYLAVSQCFREVL